MSFRTGNPALQADVFQAPETVAGERSTTMTIAGTVNCALVLLVCVLAAAGWTWYLFLANSPTILPWMLGGLLAGFVTALAIIFKPQWSPALSPIYAVSEGLFLGGISAILSARYPGIVIQAVALTIGTLACLLLAYRSGLVRATESFKLGVISATGAIALFYFVTLLLGLFHVNVSLVTGNGPLSIGISVVVVVVAALNLVLDFDFIQQGAEQGAPRYMEWYGAFALLVTLVWLYLEILRLLSKLRSR